MSSFWDLFSGNRVPRKGDDLRYTLRVTFEESIFGAQKEIEFKRSEVCPMCSGLGHTSEASLCSSCRGVGRIKSTRKLAVKIPRGVDSNTQIRILGEGDAGILGGEQGNLYIVLDVLTHSLFVRDGNDLIYELALETSQVYNGTTLEIPTPYGSEQLHISPGAYSGQEFRLHNKGVP